MGKSVAVVSDKQRLTMLNTLLSTANRQRLKQRFIQGLSGVPQPERHREDMPHGDPASYLHYLKRINGLEEESWDNSAALPGILLPPLTAPYLWPCTDNDDTVLSALINRFFHRQEEQHYPDLSRYNVKHFVYYLLDTCFSLTQTPDANTATALMRLAIAWYTLHEQLVKNRAAVNFDDMEHSYHVNGEKMLLSVTQSLNTVFEEFKEQEVITRMIKSRNWKKNALFNEVNFDEEGNQRDEKTIRTLISQKWKERRDRGTSLHEFIHHSLVPPSVTPCPAAKSPDPSIMAYDELNKFIHRLSVPPSVPPCPAAKSPDPSAMTYAELNNLPSRSTQKEEEPHLPPCRQEKQAEPMDTFDPAAAELNHLPSTSTQKEEEPHLPPCRQEKQAEPMDTLDPAVDALTLQAFSLWKTLQAQLTCESSGQSMPSGKQKNANLTSIHLLDDANKAASSCWNQLRFNHHWLLLEAEYPVYDEQASLAGTIDAIFAPYPQRPDMVVLVDWKRCEIDLGTRYYMKTRYEHPYTYRYPKCNYWKYAFQLNMYREMFERAHHGRLIVVDMMIVNFLPNSQFPKTISVPRIIECGLFINDLRKRKTQAD